MVSGLQSSRKNVDLPYDTRLPGATWTTGPSIMPSVQEAVRVHEGYIREQTLIVGPIVYKSPADFGNKDDKTVSRVVIDGDEVFVKIPLPEEGED